MKAENRKDWQADPEKIETKLVQIWTANGTMQTACCPRPDAREMVSRGRAFVVSNQAVGLCD